MADNLTLYNKFRQVPEEAKKPISGGRLRGFTDINPMWRIKVLTEQFGSVGIGWYYEIVKTWLEKGCNDEIVAFVQINLFVKADNEWSKPIVGIGGSSFVTKESKGLYTSDECYKMALTDAISISCKALGIGADVYYEKDRSKYNAAPQEKEYKCCDCGAPFEAFTDKSGKYWNAGQAFHIAENNNADKKPRCYICYQKIKR